MAICNKCGMNPAKRYERKDNNTGGIRIADLCEKHVKMYEDMGFTLTAK